MKRLLIATYIIAALVAAGSAHAEGRAFTVISPNGTGYGYRYPDGFFIFQAPVDPTPGQNPQAQGVPETNHYYGYKSGDTTIILNPGGGTSYNYDIGK